jgi:hypothetical protein
MKTFECIICNYSTENKSHYERHCLTINHNQKEQKKLICNECNKKFTNLKSFTKHKQNVHIYKKKNSTKKIIDNSITNTTTNTATELNIKLKKEFKQDIKAVNKNIIKSNQEVKKEIIKSNEEVKEEIIKSKEEVKTVVNKAITKATSLIKYLMQNHQNVPPIKKITDKESIKLLRIDYDCPSKKPNDYILEQRLIYDHYKGNFVKNISKSILNIIDHKKPKTQPIYNTDSSRYNYVIKTTDEAWDEDKAGIKFSEYIIKPFLLSIGELIREYREKNIDTVNMRKNTLKENEEHIDLLSKTLKLESDINNERLITSILRELSPFLRYLQSEIEELEKYNEMEKIQKELENIIKDESDDDLEFPINIVEYVPKKLNNIVIDDEVNDNYITKIKKRII